LSEKFTWKKGDVKVIKKVKRTKGHRDWDPPKKIAARGTRA